MRREIVFYKNYFLEFYRKQSKKTQEKIEFVLDLVRNVERVPIKFLKFLEDSEGIYEIRVQVGNNIYRILCFFDKGNIVVLVNSFQKKKQKTPKNEIELAERLKKEYLEAKK